MDRLTSLALPPPEPPIEAPTVTPELKRALMGLALALNHGLEPEQERVYAFALADLPLPFLRAACVRLAKSQTFWPKVAEIRHTVSELMREAREAEAKAKVPELPPAMAAHEPTYVCLFCLDTSWRPFRCPGQGSLRSMTRSETDPDPISECGRRFPHGSHPYVERCVCVETNPVIARDRELSRKRVTERTARQRGAA
jgi:hypothetical protein